MDVSVQARKPKPSERTGSGLGFAQLERQNSLGEKFWKEERRG